MIVVDTNVVAYLFLPGEHTEAARETLRRDPAWVAPPLWRSEFRSVLGMYIRRNEIGVRRAGRLADAAADVLHGREVFPSGGRVLELVASSTCSAYDCEFVALAQELGVSLVTSDRLILRDFGGTAVALQEFGVT